MEVYWLILPPPIVLKIKAECKRHTSRDDMPAIQAQLNGLLEELKEKKPKSYKIFCPAIPGSKKIRLSEGTLRRALGDNPKDGGVCIKNGDVRLLDFICLYAYKKTWENTLVYLGLKKEDLKTRKERIIYKYPNLRSISFISSSFWDEIDSMENERLLSRYFTHTDSFQTLGVVSTEQIVPPSEKYVVKDAGGNTEIKTISQVLDYASSHHLSLIEILGEAGTGKSTFLYWICKRYYEKYNIVSIKGMVRLQIAKTLAEIHLNPSYNGKIPLLVIIDNISKITESVADILENITVDLKSNVILVAADRENRYRSKFGTNGLHWYFGDNVQTIRYTPPDKKEVFDKVYNALCIKNIYLEDPLITEKSRALSELSYE